MKIVEEERDVTKEELDELFKESKVEPEPYYRARKVGFIGKITWLKVNDDDLPPIAKPIAIITTRQEDDDVVFDIKIYGNEKGYYSKDWEADYLKFMENTMDEKLKELQIGFILRRYTDEELIKEMQGIYIYNLDIVVSDEHLKEIISRFRKEFNVPKRDIPVSPKALTPDEERWFRVFLKEVGIGFEKWREDYDKWKKEEEDEDE